MYLAILTKFIGFMRNSIPDITAKFHVHMSVGWWVMVKKLETQFLKLTNGKRHIKRFFVVTKNNVAVAESGCDLL